MAKPTVKQHLAAIRMLFDWLVTGGILASNPATSVRGPKHVIKRGKTPVLTTDQARVLIESIDTSTPVGLRDRALIGVMTYAFARIGAVVSMRVEDYFANGKRIFRFIIRVALSPIRLIRSGRSGRPFECSGAAVIYPQGFQVRRRRRWRGFARSKFSISGAYVP
jgi:site-specific recombinase XerC